ncbi:uncharacterized protein LOC117903088 [Drosophila subobscura]|uniref:uncharacterized protein LOC117903088 n=1 Tax=Drosophila subobscura TaxID=7241 RepID=UPI00155A72B6|nr:uncharacterized protein LOC117903088 [Drosophila subobscura]
MPWNTDPKWLINVASSVPLDLMKNPREEAQSSAEQKVSPIRIKKKPSKTGKRKSAWKVVKKNTKKVSAVPTTMKCRAAAKLKKPNTEAPAEAPQEEAQPSASGPRSRKRKVKQESETWITESSGFFTGVIDETMSSLNNNINDISRSEFMSLGKVRKLWEQKYNVEERKPVANRSAAPPPPKRKRRPTQNPVKERRMSDEDAEEANNFWDMDDLEDHEIVENHISVPLLRAQFEPRRFLIMMPAFAMKQNLVQPLFNWELLNRIMPPPVEEGTKILQQVVNEMLLQYQQGSVKPT